jgi:signal transduction histidine kinase
LTLNTYYRQREVGYAEISAQMASQIVQAVQAQDLPRDAAEAQLDSYAFLARVRVRWLNAQNILIYDTGTPTTNTIITLAAMPNQIVPDNAAFITVPTAMPGSTILRSLEPPNTYTYSPVIQLGEQNRTTWQTVPQYTDEYDAMLSGVVRMYNLPADMTLFSIDGFPDSAERSDEAVNMVLDNGRGSVEISQGPAYGRRIVEQVLQLVSIIGVVAAGMGAIVGLLMSRRITQPLQHMAAITSHMAQGDLAVRCRVPQQDELGLLSQSFNNMAERVEDLVTALKRFVADAAHEIHTPLTALKTNLELAQDEPDNTARARYQHRALAQLARLQALTDGLLDLSRLESGAQHHATQPVALSTLLHEIAELYASRCEQAGIAFELSVQPSLSICGDAVQIRQVLANLLDNALKFSAAGQAIHLTAGAINNQINISVRDHGIGIPAEELPLVFNRFHRCRNATDYAGNGLGLAIVQHIVTQHNGDIHAQNAAPGARFIVSLPAL